MILVRLFSDYFLNFLDGIAQRPRPSEMGQPPRRNSRTKTTEFMGMIFIKQNFQSQQYIDQLMGILREDQLLALNKEAITDPCYFFSDHVVATMIMDDLFSQSTKLFPRLSTRSTEWEHFESGSLFSEFILGSFAQCKALIHDLIAHSLLTDFLNHISHVHIKSPFSVPGEAVYAVDISRYSQFPVRPEFAKYGAIAYFDASYHPCGIWHCESERIVFPGEPAYPHISLLFRSSLMMECIIYYHLFYIHWFLSNNVAVISEKTLSTVHPIRRLLYPHTFGSTRMNYACFTCHLPYGSLLSRLTAFTEESWEAVLRRNTLRLHYEPFPRVFQQTGLPEESKKVLPLYMDGLDYWNITERYVQRYFDIIYPDDHLLCNDPELDVFWQELSSKSSNSLTSPLSRSVIVEYITNYIFSVTGLNQLFASINEYPALHFPMKVFQGKEEADIQTCILQTCFIAMIAGKLPKLLNNWWAGNVFNEMALPSQLQTHIDSIEIEKNHMEWQESLRVLAEKIEQRNVLDRACPFQAMNPKYMECSVSL